MVSAKKQIIAMGGGGFSMEDSPLLDQYILNQQDSAPDQSAGLNKACPHYDGEANRRPAYRQFIAEGKIIEGVAADDGAALHYEGEDLAHVVTSRPNASAYRVRKENGQIIETAINAKYLGA